jgi:hypothetical protein
MSAVPYWYFEKYQLDVDAVLQALRQREFQAGRYNPVIPDPVFPPSPDSASPGAQHASIREAMLAAGAEGTRSILDLGGVSEQPGFGVVSPLSEEALESIYGTTMPTREMVEEDMAFLEETERGHGVYIILYRDGEPDEILFAGYSFD